MMHQWMIVWWMKVQTKIESFTISPGLFADENLPDKSKNELREENVYLSQPKSLDFKAWVQKMLQATNAKIDKVSKEVSEIKNTTQWASISSVDAWSDNFKKQHMLPLQRTIRTPRKYQAGHLIGNQNQCLLVSSLLQSKKHQNSHLLKQLFNS